MHKDALAQMQFEAEMRQALELEEFFLHYQTTINLNMNNIAGLPKSLNKVFGNLI